MNNNRFDPKLKLMMEELEPIFKKYEVFAFVSATSRTHGEFRWFLPDYSVISIDRNGLRFKAKSGVDRHEDVEATVFGLMGAHDMGKELYLMAEKIYTELKKHMQIDHTQMPIYSHGED
jgi:hypothetical protein